MPFWKRSASDDQQQDAQAQQDAEDSLLSLEAGGLPMQAKRRLQEETAAGHPLFTSDLSASEFLLTRQSGFTSLGQVMGSAIYHIGANSLTLKNRIDVLSQAHQQAAKLALGRLRQEAALLHAHGVIGVRFTRKRFAWEQEILEYMAIGTAIRLGNEPPTQSPFLSNLSGQEFWALMQVGYEPVGLVTGFCSDAAVVTLGSLPNLKAYDYYNQEIILFSMAIQNARKQGMNRLMKSARDVKAEGVVGMQIEIEKEFEREREEQVEMGKLLVHFSAIGTAITSRIAEHTLPKPAAALTFTDLRPGRSRTTRELTTRS